MGSWAERTQGKVVAGGPGWARQRLAGQAVPHLCVDTSYYNAQRVSCPCDKELQRKFSLVSVPTKAMVLVTNW